MTIGGSAVNGSCEIRPRESNPIKVPWSPGAEQKFNWPEYSLCHWSGVQSALFDQEKEKVQIVGKATETSTAMGKITAKISSIFQGCCCTAVKSSRNGLHFWQQSYLAYDTAVGTSNQLQRPLERQGACRPVVCQKRAFPQAAPGLGMAIFLYILAREHLLLWMMNGFSVNTNNLVNSPLQFTGVTSMEVAVASRGRISLSGKVKINNQNGRHCQTRSFENDINVNVWYGKYKHSCNFLGKFGARRGNSSHSLLLLVIFKFALFVSLKKSFHVAFWVPLLSNPQNEKRIGQPKSYFPLLRVFPFSSEAKIPFGRFKWCRRRRK